MYTHLPHGVETSAIPATVERISPNATQNRTTTAPGIGAIKMQLINEALARARMRRSRPYVPRHRRPAFQSLRSRQRRRVAMQR